MSKLSTVQKAELLRNVSIFVRMSDEDLQQIAELAQEVHFEVGQELVKEDGETDCLYVLLDGSGQMVIDAVSGVALHRNRGIVGELTLFSPQPCSTFALASTPVHALQIEYKVFWELLKAKPELGLGVVIELNLRLNEVIDQFYRLGRTATGEELPVLFATEFLQLEPEHATTPLTGFDEDAEMKRKTAVLKRVHLFKHLSEDGLREAATRAQEESYEKGERFIQQDSLTTSVYVLLEGEADVVVEGVGVVGQRSSGNVVGEMALISRKPRTAHCIAKQPIKALRFTYDDFWQLVELEPQMSIGIIREMNGRLEEGIENIRQLSLELRDQQPTP